MFFLIFACKKESSSTSNNTNTIDSNQDTTNNTSNSKGTNQTTVTSNKCGTDYSVYISHSGYFSKNYCVDKNNLVVKTINNSTDKKFKVLVCIQRSDGTWDKGQYSLSPGKSDNYWSCNCTGKYQIQVLEYTDWYEGHCKFNYNIK